MNRPLLENFGLKQVKVIDGGVKVTASPEFTEGASVYKTKMADEWPITPSPDLTDLFLQLKSPLAKCHGLLDFETIMKSSEFKATKDQLKWCEKMIDSKMSDTKVTGISISGQDGNRGVIITGIYDGQSINSKKLKFSATTYGFEEDLESITNQIIEETFKYVYDGKKAQLEAFPGQEDGKVIDGTGEEFEKDHKMAAAGEQ